MVKAKAEVSRTVQALEEKVTQFECQKMHDMKTILLDFIAIEIGFHAKALEQLTAAFKDIRAVDEDSDLDVITKFLS